jgi:hypothetical protein
MRPTARRGSCSTQAHANTGTGRSIWGLPRQRLGGGRAAVASAGDAREGGEQRCGREGATRGHVQELEVELR